jgi:hypothetical protein
MYGERERERERERENTQGWNCTRLGTPGLWWMGLKVREDYLSPLIAIINPLPGASDHACNPSYLGSRIQYNKGLRPARANSS